MRFPDDSCLTMENVSTSNAIGVRYLSDSEIEATIPGMPMTCRSSCLQTTKGFAWATLASSRPMGRIVFLVSLLLVGAVTRRRILLASVSASFSDARSSGEPATTSPNSAYSLNRSGYVSLDSTSHHKAFAMATFDGTKLYAGRSVPTRS